MRERFEEKRKKSGLVSEPVSKVVNPLVPQETKEEILRDLEAQQDTGGLWLYQLTGIQSSDVGFTWGTDMLLHRVLTYAFEAETEEDFVNSLKYFHQDGCLYELLQDYVHQIYTETKQHEDWFL